MDVELIIGVIFLKAKCIDLNLEDLKMFQYFRSKTEMRNIASWISFICSV